MICSSSNAWVLERLCSKKGLVKHELARVGCLLTIIGSAMKTTVGLTSRLLLIIHLSTAKFICELTRFCLHFRLSSLNVTRYYL